MVTSLPPRLTTTTCSMLGVVVARLVGGGLEREHLTAPVPAVGGDQHLRLGVVDAVAERLAGEPAEHDAVSGADPRAREHRDRRFGDHRQVDVDPVALLDAQPLEDVREAAHLVEQVLVGDRPGVAGFTLPVERDPVTPAGEHVPIEAVVRHVQRAALEPLGVRKLPVEDRVPLAVPVDELRRLPRPEPLVVLGCLVVELGSR